MVYHLLLESTYWRGVYQLLSIFFSGFHDIALPVASYRSFNGVCFCFLGSFCVLFVNDEQVSVVKDVFSFCQECVSIIFGVCFF